MQVLGVEVRAKSSEYDWEPPSAPSGLDRAVLVDDDASANNVSILAEAIGKRMATWKPDAIVLPGWSSAAAIAGLIWATENHTPAIVMSETNAADARRHVVGEFIKRRILKLFDAGLCGGTLAHSYLVQLGVRGDHVFLGYDAVDNGYFAAGVDAVRRNGAYPAAINPEWRGRFFLASARFIPKKNLQTLILAYAQYREATGSAAWRLVLLGNGPLSAELQLLRGNLGLVDSLAMPGFIQYGELPLYYGNAGAFVHASVTEQWGLVVNEAMASGLPVLVSETCGCAPDLVQSGRNGYTFEPHDVIHLAKLMSDVSSDKCDRASMARASIDIVEKFSPQAFAEGLERAARAAINFRSRRSGWFDQALLWTLSHR